MPGFEQNEEGAKMLGMFCKAKLAEFSKK